LTFSRNVKCEDLTPEKFLWRGP